MKKIVVATNNNNKLKEIRSILGDRFELLSMADAGVFEEIEENGSSFLENALIKASFVSKKTGLTALADDSGLCVHALKGAPGIFSARYSGENANDERNNKLLLENLKDENNRAAHFHCCAALCQNDGSYIYAEGKAEGEILRQIKGSGGFGYDPLFYSFDLKKTFAEADFDEKNKVSHRYRALLVLREKL